MTEIKELPAQALYTRCNPDEFAFESTSELHPRMDIPCQSRAAEAVHFGLGIDQEGYNIFALGPSGTGKQFLIERFVRQSAANKPIPSDPCYVNNFSEPNKPCLLMLPGGVGASLKNDLREFIDEVISTLPRVFESDEYQTKVNGIRQSVKTGPDEGISDLRQRAREKGIALLHTPVGVVFAPMKDGSVLSPEEFGKLSPTDQKTIAEAIEQLEQELAAIMQQVPRWEREVRAKIRDLNREMTEVAVGHLLDELRTSYAPYENVVRFLNSVQKDLVDHARHFIPQDGSPAQGLNEMFRGAALARRYDVNILVDHSSDKVAPVVLEDHPTYDNLLGRIEHLTEMGTLVTDFSLIRPGALHKANGGYLIVDARKLLMSPYAWEALKRVLQSREIRIESVGQALGLVSTVSLDPEPVPMNIKVILLGDRILYYLLCQHDPDFPELFKVAADFDDVIDRNTESERMYAELIASVAASHKLHPFQQRAVMRLIEYSARIAGDAEKLSTQVRQLIDVLNEADYYTLQARHSLVTVEDVQAAIDAHTRRSDRVRERLLEATLKKTIYIDTEGTQTGQVNGLSVVQLNGFAFGHPSRITASMRLGKGEVIDIEREVELSGPIHSKGVLILTAFLGSRYAREFPLSISASLVFEQSYAGIEGDSASSAELYALLSTIADLPVKQSLAVTGSVNQHGEIQPIGGVNEKIEGFFDVCKARGLTGDQGVLIPASNIKNLMLRQDVVDAVSQGRFHIFPVKTVDEGIYLLTGIEAGQVDGSGAYPEGTVNHLVQRRLQQMAETQYELSHAELVTDHV
jgi:lon-related putative ATP-dependent protease